MKKALTIVASAGLGAIVGFVASRVKSGKVEVWYERAPSIEGLFAKMQQGQHEEKEHEERVDTNRRTVAKAIFGNRVKVKAKVFAKRIQPYLERMDEHPVQVTTTYARFLAQQIGFTLTQDGKIDRNGY